MLSGYFLRDCCDYSAVAAGSTPLPKSQLELPSCSLSDLLLFFREPFREFSLSFFRSSFGGGRAPLRAAATCTSFALCSHFARVCSLSERGGGEKSEGGGEVRIRCGAGGGGGECGLCFAVSTEAICRCLSCAFLSSWVLISVIFNRKCRNCPFFRAF